MLLKIHVGPSQRAVVCHKDTKYGTVLYGTVLCFTLLLQISRFVNCKRRSDLMQLNDAWLRMPHLDFVFLT